MSSQKHEIVVHQEHQFSGPLPHPDVLVGYEKIDPTFPERIMKMAEANNDASIQHEKSLIEGSLKNERRGQWLAFFLGVLGLIVGVVLSLLGFSSAAIAAIIGSLAPILIASINSVGNKSNKS